MRILHFLILAIAILSLLPFSYGTQPSQTIPATSTVIGCGQGCSATIQFNGTTINTQITVSPLYPQVPTVSTTTLILVAVVIAVAVGVLVYGLHERSIEKLRKQTTKKPPDEK